MIHIVIGTRAQLIKMVPVMYALRSRHIAYNFVFLAQHHKTIDDILQQFQLKLPDYRVAATGSDIVSSRHMVVWSLRVILHGFLNKKVIFQYDSEGIALVHGDAPPLLLGALLAKMQGLRVAAVEAGLRSFNFLQPFPEELIRVVTARMGLLDIFFCQDKQSADNVSQYKKTTVCTHANTMYDMLQLTREVLGVRRSIDKRDRYALVTLHRFETIANKKTLMNVLALVQKVSQSIRLKFILHPPTERALQKYGVYKALENSDTVELLPRLDFLSFHQLMLQAEFIITDGGSNQEESAYLGIPCLLMRNRTERHEGLGSNVVLSHFNAQSIADFIRDYQQYRVQTEITGQSPTEIILQTVQKYQ